MKGVAATMSRRTNQNMEDQFKNGGVSLTGSDSDGSLPTEELAPQGASASLGPQPVSDDTTKQLEDEIKKQLNSIGFGM